jgi:hypothetical protein
LLLIPRRIKRREEEIINKVGRCCEGHYIYYGKTESFISLKAVLARFPSEDKTGARQRAGK